MLFDLRGRGRRRAVQVIYVSLAILMGGGLVLFGIGGATSGGLLDAFKSDAGSTSANDVFKKRVEQAEQQVKTSPANPAAWANLTRVRFQQASVGDGFDQNQGVFTDKGKDELRGAENAWDRYLKLTEKPSDTIAVLMVQAFGSAGLDKPDRAVEAQEIVMDSRKPTSQQYVQLASLAYAAGQTRKAELASKKAIDLAPKDDKEQIKAELQAARQANSSTLDDAAVQAGASSATPSS
jgi:hypothetical protein